MNKSGVLMRDGMTQEVMQIAYELSFGEALGIVINMRSQKDGNYYWIGVL